MMIDPKEKELAMKILDVIMQDMGGIASHKLVPKEVSVEVSKEHLEVGEMGHLDGEAEETPEEEASESPAEEAAEEESGEEENLPRWKQRIKDHLKGK